MTRDARTHIILRQLPSLASFRAFLGVCGGIGCVDTGAVAARPRFSAAPRGKYRQIGLARDLLYKEFVGCTVTNGNARALRVSVGVTQEEKRS